MLQWDTEYVYRTIGHLFSSGLAYEIFDFHNPDIIYENLFGPFISMEMAKVSRGAASQAKSIGKKFNINVDTSQYLESEEELEKKKIKKAHLRKALEYFSDVFKLNKISENFPLHFNDFDLQELVKFTIDLDKLEITQSEIPFLLSRDSKFVLTDAYISQSLTTLLNETDKTIEFKPQHI